MFVTFLLFQRELYVVLARGNGPKSSFRRDLLKTKNPNIFRGLHPLTPTRALPWTRWGGHSTPRPPAAFYAPYECVRLAKLLIPLQYYLSLKFGACYIKGQWGEFRVKNYFLAFLLFIIKFAFSSISFLFLIKYEISAAEYQPIRNRNWWSKLSVELHVTARGKVFGQTDFPKCLKNVIFPKFLVNTLVTKL